MHRYIDLFTKKTLAYVAWAHRIAGLVGLKLIEQNIVYTDIVSGRMLFNASKVSLPRWQVVDLTCIFEDLSWSISFIAWCKYKMGS